MAFYSKEYTKIWNILNFINIAAGKYDIEQHIIKRTDDWGTKRNNSDKEKKTS